MARLRTSLVSAIESATNEYEKGNISMETAAHKAALKYNEKENEILNKLVLNQQKKERKGKVGRPPKNLQVADIDENITEKIKLKNFSYVGPVLFKKDNKEFSLNINYSTKTNNFSKAKEEVLKFFFENNVLCYISEEDFKNYLINE